jgi:NADH-quinone oxidoreductase subunit A
LNAYLPVLLFIVAAVAFGAINLLLSWGVRPSQKDPGNIAPQVCGIENIEDPRQRLSVHYYLIAVLFVVFDVETIFLFPWAVQFKVLGWFGFVEMTIFIFILVVAYLYAWKKGALEWV